VNVLTLVANSIVIYIIVRNEELEMRDETIEGLPASASSNELVSGDVKKFPIPDTPVLGSNHKPITTFTDMAVLLLRTGGSATGYFSATTRDNGWKCDVNVKVFLMISNVKVETHDLGIMHAFCGATPQQATFGINVGFFDDYDAVEVEFQHIPGAKRC
jgi:hypothetical protein